MVIFIENGEICFIAVTCWQGVYILVLWLWNCGCLKVFACVFMMQHCGTISLQALLINLGQYMWNALKIFFGYTKFYSVTAMFNELNLQHFDSLIDKCRMDFQRQVNVCDKGIVQHFVYLHLMWLYVRELCETVLLYISLLFCHCLFLLLFYYFLRYHCSMGSVLEIKIDW